MSLSNFLPSYYKVTTPLTLIAGKGHYPMELALGAREAGAFLRLVAFEGETSPELWEFFGENERVAIKVGQVGKLLKALRDFESPYAIMAGQITPGRLFKGLHPDLRALKLLLQVKPRTAHNLFCALANEMESHGTTLLDARSFMDKALTPKGVFQKGSWLPSPELLAQASALAQKIAALDIGQGLVLDEHGTVLAVEAFEGTNAMLQRAGQFGAKRTLFAKTPSPKQDYRFDVPVFGPTTVEHMHTHHIHAAALETGTTLIVQKEKTLELCKKYKISLLGV